MVTAPINHICVDERGVAHIAGTRIKVRHIVIEHNTWKQTPRQIQESYPHLSLAQIYAALAYYHDNQDQLDAEIMAAEELADRLRVAQPNPMTRQDFEERLRSEDADSSQS